MAEAQGSNFEGQIDDMLQGNEGAEGTTTGTGLPATVPGTPAAPETPPPATTAPPETPPTTEAAPPATEAPPVTIEDLQKQLQTQQADFEKQSAEGKVRESDLQKKVELYEPLLRKQTDTPAQPPVTPQDRVATFRKDISDRIDVKDDHIRALLSGDIEQGKAVVKELASTMAMITHDIVLNSVYSGLSKSQETSKYNNQVISSFYGKYPDLKEYPEIVTVIGNRIGEEYPGKAPHELTDLIGNAVRDYVKKIQGGGGNGKTLVTRGEGGGTKGAPPATAPMSDQQKEMVDAMTE